MEQMIFQLLNDSPMALALIYTANVLRRQIQQLRSELKEEIHTLNTQIAVIVERTDSHSHRIDRLEETVLKRL